MVSIRVLVAMALGALVATAGALFLGEYEFDELLPIAAGPLLGLVMAEIVVSIGHNRTKTMAVMVAVGAAVSVVLAGHIDANGVGPVKIGAYGSAVLAAAIAALRTIPFGKAKEQAASAALADQPTVRHGQADIPASEPVADRSPPEPRATTGAEPPRREPLATPRHVSRPAPSGRPTGRRRQLRTPRTSVRIGSQLEPSDPTEADLDAADAVDAEPDFSAPGSSGAGTAPAGRSSRKRPGRLTARGRR